MCPMDVSAAEREITEPDSDVRAELHQEFIQRFQHLRSSAQIEHHPEFENFRNAIERSLQTPEVYSCPRTSTPLSRNFVRMACWNIERGTHYDRIVDQLRTHPVLSDHDVLLVTEVDHGMARSGNRHVTQDLAQAMNCHGVFAPSHLNFDMGNGPEAHRTQGKNTVALQGHALFSKFPLKDIELVPLPEPKDLMNGKDERQYGHENALVATLETPQGELHVAANHLSARSSRKQRVEQMKCILKALKKRKGPALIGGDWNTHTYNSHTFSHMLLGGLHRCLCGINKTLCEFYPGPDLFFEKKLFQTLKDHGFAHESFNVPNATTVHYNFMEPEKIIHMKDWLPDWALKIFLKAMKRFDGKASLKLDWFAGRELHASNPRIIFDLPKGEKRISDHDPIMVDIRPIQRGNA